MVLEKISGGEFFYVCPLSTFSITDILEFSMALFSTDAINSDCY